jgi:hypothetical protein
MMGLITIETITREALEILDQAFDGSYAKYNRKLLGGNSYVHGLGRLYEGFDSVDAADEGLSDAQDAARYALGFKTQGR